MSIMLVFQMLVVLVMLAVSDVLSSRRAEVTLFPATFVTLYLC